MKESKEQIPCKFPTEVEKWNQEQVIGFLRPHIDEKYIEKIREQEVDGSGLLLLTEEVLTRKSGSFEFPYGPAITIVKLIQKLKESKEGKQGE